MQSKSRTELLKTERYTGMRGSVSHVSTNVSQAPGVLCLPVCVCCLLRGTYLLRIPDAGVHLFLYKLSASAEATQDGKGAEEEQIFLFFSNSLLPFRCFFLRKRPVIPLFRRRFE